MTSDSDHPRRMSILKIGIVHYGSEITAELITNEMQREIFREEPATGELVGAREGSDKRPEDRKLYDVGPAIKAAFEKLARWPEFEFFCEPFPK